MWRQIMTWRQWISALSIAMLASAVPLPQSPCAHAQTTSEPPRFTFKIDSNTPVKELLPVAPVISEPMPPWLVKDLAQVPEVFFQKPMQAVTTLGGKELKKTEADLETMRQTAHVLAKVNHLNKHGTDHFLKVLVKE